MLLLQQFFTIDPSKVGIPLFRNMEILKLRIFVCASSGFGRIWHKFCYHENLNLYIDIHWKKLSSAIMICRIFILRWVWSYKGWIYTGFVFTFINFIAWCVFKCGNFASLKLNKKWFIFQIQPQDMSRFLYMKNMAKIKSDF